MKKTNILFILPNFDMGGSEKLVVDIIRNTDRKKFFPVLCVFFSGKYEQEFLKLNVPFYVIHKDKLRSKLSTIKFLNDIVRRHKITVVNTHHTSPLVHGFIPFKILNRLFWVHTEHTRLDLDPNINPGILRIEKLLLKAVDVTIGISREVCEYFKTELGVPLKKIRSINNGVDLDRFKPDQSVRSSYRQQLGLLPADIAIGLFANFREQKNHPVLIQAARLLKDKYGQENFCIILAGSGPTEEDSRRLVKEKNLERHVLFLGPRMDIPQLMQAIDIYCLPSFFEGLPFSLLEAMAAGIAIVATDVNGTKDVIQNGQNGILVESDNAQALALAIKDCAINLDLRQKIAQQAVEDSKRFSLEAMLEEYETIFLKNGK